MPNHVTNWVHIAGPKDKLDELVKKTKLVRNANAASKGIKQEFDFNGIIPMPTELENTISPTEVVETQEEADKLNDSEKQSVFTEGKIKAISRAEAERRIRQYGESAAKNKAEELVSAILDNKYQMYGHGSVLNWYDFACKYWGTKWGAYDVSYMAGNDTEIFIQFDTAWSPPFPIFDKLVELGFTVNAKYQDEDPSNEGEYGNPYDVFEINHPQLEVEPIVSEDRS